MGRPLFAVLASRLVLDHVPVLNEDTVFDPEYVRHDPVDWQPKPRRTAREGSQKFPSSATITPGFVFLGSAG